MNYCLKWSYNLNSRKRREEDRNNLSQIKAEMETVYNVQGKGDAGKTLVFPHLRTLIKCIF